MTGQIKTVHEGRGGYVELGGVRYTIDHVEGGVFCIHFPSGNKHPDPAAHRDALIAFAKSHDPKWYLGD